MFKDKKIQIIGGVLVAILLVLGIYFFVVRKANQNAQPVQEQSQIDTGPINISPESIGLVLEAGSGNKKVQFKIGKISGIKSISYELTYEADSTIQERTEGGDARIQRGITGETKINSSENSYRSPWLDLGSASKNVVRYDTGVTSVDLVLKIVKSDNKTYQAEKKLDL